MRDPATVYRWLAEVDNSNLQNLVFRSLARQATAALQTEQPAPLVFQTLKTFTEKSQDRYLIYEGRLLLALDAYQSGHNDRALQFLEEAQWQVEGEQPYQAIAGWMQGCVYFRANLVGEGLSAWDNSLYGFNLLALDPGYLPVDWVSTRRAQMLVALEQAVDQLPGGLAPVQPGVRTGPEPPARPPASSPLHPSGPPAPSPTGQARPGRPPQAWPPGQNIALYAGFDQIPAGEPVRLGVEGESYDALEMDQLLVNNRRYSLHAPPGASPPGGIRLDQFFMLQVKGDSMNRAGIDSGDYVLLRLQGYAQHNDIVAADIAGVDYEATLKRYRSFEGGRRVVLLPESDNPNHPVREFTNGQNAEGRYRIVGVVVAVLKPM